MLYDKFGKRIRSMHMCGPSVHLHHALIRELDITSFDLFGYHVEPDQIKETMGGRVKLWGNIDPMLMLSGTKDEIYTKVMKTLETLGPISGYMLGDGANVCPGTPIENINVLVEASRKYSKIHPELFLMTMSLTQ